MKASQKGFTLIELVVVITILGILAAFAIPRFAGLETSARIAALNGLAGSIRSASALAHSVALVNGVTTGNISMEGQTVTVSNGYPTADAAGIEAALQDLTGFSQAGGVFTMSDAPTPATCSVTYTAATALLPASVSAPTTTGC